MNKICSRKCIEELNTRVLHYVLQDDLAHCMFMALEINRTNVDQNLDLIL